jgi:thioredoxin-dependent peroxiredoxin
MAALRLGDTAPNFTAATTEGEIDFYDWKDGQWAVLFSHPADFTPVCTTELGYLASIKDEFDKRNTKVIAVSVDPLDSHQGWAGDIGEVGGTELNYPIIADDDRKVAEAYDMIHPGEGDTSTVRSVFVIAPDNTVKLSLTYPKSTGRNFDEIVRVIDSLQVTSAHGLSTPVQWEKGDKVIVPPTLSTDDAKAKYGDVDEKKPYLRYVDEPAS